MFAGAIVPEGLLIAAVGVAAVLLARLALDVVKLRRVKHRATVIGRLRVRRAALGTSPAVSTPTAIGYVRPAVIVPRGFRARVDAAEWDAVLAHESAHLARRDDWAKAAQSALTRAAWWLPGLAMLARALDLDRELAADERAAAAGDSRAYAACLLRLATDAGAAIPAPRFGARRTQVAVRVERLLARRPPCSPVARAAALGASTAVAAAAILAAVTIVPPAGERVHGAVAHPRHRVLVAARFSHASRPATHRGVRAHAAAPLAARPAAAPSSGATRVLRPIGTLADVTACAARAPRVRGPLAKRPNGPRSFLGPRAILEIPARLVGLKPSYREARCGSNTKYPPAAWCCGGTATAWKLS